MSRHIPNEVKREVRRQCHFGCAICGMPFFHYDHIDEYSSVGVHDVDNIVLLCPNHHAMKGTKGNAGKLSIERINEARLKPFNATRYLSGSFPLEQSRAVEILFGDCTLTYEHDSTRGPGICHLIWVNGYDFLAMHREQNWNLLTLSLVDWNGNSILIAEKGELRLVSSRVGDFEYIGDKMTVRDARGGILASLRLSNDRFELIHGCMRTNHGDGCAINAKDGFLTVYCNNKPLTWMMGASFYMHGPVAYGICVLNRKNFPDVLLPRNFAYCREITPDCENI